MNLHAWNVMWVAIGALVVIGAMALAWWAARHPDGDR